MTEVISKENREDAYREEFRKKLFQKILPEMLLQDDLTAIVDVVRGVDKRRLVSQVLREVAQVIDDKYTISDIQGGFCE